MDMYTLLYLKWKTNGALLNVMGQADGRGVWGRMDTFIYS